MKDALPLTVIGGYLGAGKTTLINRLLQEDHGKRLMVMVNDFGDVNIDATLLASASDDTLELTNGCVCCTMGADLFMAVGDVLDRPTRPDHLIIEASGIADPARIAEVARAEPDLTYNGIVTVVDGLNIDALLADTRIAPQVADQIRVADILLISKTPTDPGLHQRLKELGSGVLLPADAQLGPFLWDLEAVAPAPAGAHAHFRKWSVSGGTGLDLETLEHKLKTRPPALYRLKGFVAGPEGSFLVQVVGKAVEITPSEGNSGTNLVGIGLSGKLDPAVLDAWWE